MKKYLLVFTLLLCCAWKRLDLPPLTEATVNDKKEQCKMQLDAMFYDYNIVLNSKNKEEQRFGTIDEMQQNYFTDNALIDGNTDVSVLHKEKYEVKVYFSNLQEALSQLNASLKTDVKSISDIRFDEQKSRYFIMANVDKKITPHPGFVMDGADTATRSVDIYFGFTLEDRKPKIYSVQQHHDDALQGFSALPVVSDQIADSTLSESKSYVVFKVTPSDAQVLIDGQPTFYSNGQQLEVSPGTHQITISSNNFIKQDFPVTVENTSTTAIEKDLDPQGGFLNVNASTASDNGAAIYINDIQVGNVPLNDYPLATGRYNIRIAKDSYEKLGVVGIAANRSVTVSASLSSRQFLSGVIESGYRPVTVVLLPHYYFGAPVLHTFRGAIIDPYYTAGKMYRARTVPNISHYSNHTIWHQQGQLFHPQAGYRFSGPRNNFRQGNVPNTVRAPRGPYGSSVPRNNFRQAGAVSNPVGSPRAPYGSSVPRSNFRQAATEPNPTGAPRAPYNPSVPRNTSKPAATEPNPAGAPRAPYSPPVPRNNSRPAVVPAQVPSPRAPDKPDRKLNTPPKTMPGKPVKETVKTKY